MRKRLCIAFLIICLAFGAGASSASEQLKAANAAYQKKDFDEAIKLYQAVLQGGAVSEALHYNLGNCYFRTNQYGRAVLHYERALLFDPDDADTRHNLAVIQNRLPDKIETLSEFFLTAWLKKISYLRSARGWSLQAIVLLWLGMGGLALWLLGSIRQQKKAGFIAGFFLLSLSAASFLFASYRHQALQQHRRAVIMQSEAALHLAADAQSSVERVLHEGTTLSVLDSIGQWYKINLANGDQGWLLKEKVEKI